MKFTYVFLVFVGIIAYNVFLIQRDQKMFDSYDRACAVMPSGHPDCVFAKKK